MNLEQDKGRSKQDIVNSISAMALNSVKYQLSTGSSVPNRFFVDLENRFALPVARGMESKAATFCDYFGVEWTPDCDSAFSPSGGGGTVTRTGLNRLEEAVKRALSLEN